jgi:uncharacterized protein HemX
MTNINDPQLAEEIKESVAKKLAEIKGFTEEQPVALQAQCAAEPEPLPIAEEVKGGNNTAVIVVLLALLMFLASGVGIFFIWKKHQDRQVPGPQPVMKDGMTPEEMRNALKPWVDSTNKRLDVLEKRADAADKRMDIMSHRQWALSIAFNNNASMQEYTLRQTNPDMADKVVWLDPDWKLTKAPAFVQLTDEDRRKLMEGIK